MTPTPEEDGFWIPYFEQAYWIHNNLLFIATQAWIHQAFLPLTCRKHYLCQFFNLPFCFFSIQAASVSKALLSSWALAKCWVKPRNPILSFIPPSFLSLCLKTSFRSLCYLAQLMHMKGFLPPVDASPAQGGSMLSMHPLIQMLLPKTMVEVMGTNTKWCLLLAFSIKYLTSIGCLLHQHLYSVQLSCPSILEKQFTAPELAAC